MDPRFHAHHTQGSFSVPFMVPPIALARIRLAQFSGTGGSRGSGVPPNCDPTFPIETLHPDTA